MAKTHRSIKQGKKPALLSAIEKKARKRAKKRASQTTPLIVHH